MENGENALSSRKLKMFIDEYRNHADAYRQDYEDEDCFYEYLDSRSIVKDEKKTKQLIHDKWDEILERMLIIDKIDSQLTSSKDWNDRSQKSFTVRFPEDLQHNQFRRRKS